jgi:hypothetical protein
MTLWMYPQEEGFVILVAAGELSFFDVFNVKRGASQEMILCDFVIADYAWLD